jgi:dihydrofolate synthase/folylpolyglutamate synthase
MPPPLDQPPSGLPVLAATESAGAILARLQKLYPTLIDLSLERVQRLLAALGNPQQNLPPVIHVAGTNGKGSTCAFLRAMGEAAGLRVHVTTSPHLVRLNERFRVAGELVSDGVLEATLAEIEQVNAGAPITVFEVLAATAYLLFSRVPADLAVIEVGLGGRYDATNVLPRPAATAITSISLDHQEFLGNQVERIAWEKAGIMKPGCPVVTGLQTPGVLAVLRACAAESGATLLARGESWNIRQSKSGLLFDDAGGSVALAPPSLPGAHQMDNAGIAVAALRATGLPLSENAYGGLGQAVWPARLQRLHGTLAHRLGDAFELWLDGGHNADAGRVLADQLDSWTDRPSYLIVGMKQTKDAASFLSPLVPRAAGVWAVAEPGQHLAMPIAGVIEASGGAALAGPDLDGAFAQIAPRPPGRVLVCGSLYLAGEVLKADRTIPV